MMPLTSSSQPTCALPGTPRARLPNGVKLVLMGVIGLPLVALLLALGTLWIALQRQPLVQRQADISPAHIERALALFRQNDPRRLYPGVLRTVSLRGADVDLAVNYAAQRFARGGAVVLLRDGRATVQLSLPLRWPWPLQVPGRFPQPYLNVQADMLETRELPVFEHLRLGDLPVPAAVSNWVLKTLLKQLAASADFHATASVIKTLHFSPDTLVVQYDWKNELPAQLRAALFSSDELQRLRAYQYRLADVTRDAGGASLQLEELLQPLLALAAQRSGTSGSNRAVQEHRSAIVALAFYVNGKGLGVFVPGARTWAQPVPRQVQMADRSDLPLHFMISAALAATAGSPLADAVGLYKEIEDSRGGSGFSFDDIAADRAGTRFGQLATAGQADATKLQHSVARGLQREDFMPVWSDLPSFLPEAEFIRRFGGIGAPAYTHMMAKIESRLDDLPLYR